MNLWTDTDQSNAILEALSPFLITTFQTCHWFCNYVPENNPLEVRLYQINKQSMEIIFSEYDKLFSEHTFLKKPEDICFFLNGKLLMGTVLHERICFAYEENQVFIDSIMQVGKWQYKIGSTDEQIIIFNFSV